jgi:hypothetical protein
MPSWAAAGSALWSGAHAASAAAAHGHNGSTQAAPQQQERQHGWRAIAAKSDREDAESCDAATSRHNQAPAWRQKAGSAAEAARTAACGRRQQHRAVVQPGHGLSLSGKFRMQDMHVHALACNTVPVKDGHLQLGNQTLFLLLQLGPFFTRKTVRTEVQSRQCSALCICMHSA